jgi:hypothetical protein
MPIPRLAPLAFASEEVAEDRPLPKVWLMPVAANPKASISLASGSLTIVSDN